MSTQQACLPRSALMAAWRARRKASEPVAACEILAKVMQRLGMSADEGWLRERLRQLWINWNMVMGPDLADMAHPLGRHGSVLLLGAEDALLVQELHFQSGEILERVNAFMEKAVFDSVKVELLLGRQDVRLQSLSREPSPDGTNWRTPRGPVDVQTPLSGAYLSSMDAQSIVARAYANFVRRSAALKQAFPN